MAEDTATKGEGRPAKRSGGARRLLFRALLGVLLLALVIGWLSRKDIAETLIADTLAEYDIRASYEIETIGPYRQVLTDIVLGDPARPDLTIERLELAIRPRLGLPDVTRLHLTRPRLYGTLEDGRLSFGELDPLIFGDDEDDAPFEFPNVELTIDDGRGLLETQFGRVGLKLAGGGHLRGGFEAEIAAVSRELDFGGCALDAPSLYGEVSIDAERPRFSGPVRFAALECADRGLAVADGSVEVAARADRNLADFEGDYALSVARTVLADAAAEGMTGRGRFTWRGDGFAALYAVAAENMSTPQADAAGLAVEGRIRAFDRFGRLEVNGEADGRGISMGPALDSAIAGAAEAGRGTLVEPLLNRLGLNLARAALGSTLAAAFDLRSEGGVTNLALPEARLRSANGATFLALSRAQMTFGETAVPRIAGDIETGGNGLPQITGRMEQRGDGLRELRLAMREYASGNARLAIPAMRLAQSRDGSIAMEGRVLASGGLPGGFAEGLVLPVDGTLAADGSLALWDGCRTMRFERLALANLALDGRQLRLCPPSGRPILRYGANGLDVAAGAPSLDLAGTIADTPIRLRSGAAAFAWPGAVVARDLDISLGPVGNAQRFVISDLSADMSRGGAVGAFAGADVTLASVPLDIGGAEGRWTYRGGRLQIDGAGFSLTDRQEAARFEPLVAEGASLSLDDSVIRADAVLRHPDSGRGIAAVAIRHDLSAGEGTADLDLPGVTFDSTFQPLDLTRLALGVVANVEGTVTGEGQISWNDAGVTSTGAFSSESLDLAAAFGPVEGASGTVVFTDLLGLTTAPGQRLSLASVNPGIEIFDGEVAFRLVDGERLEIEGGTWPFMGGTLTMRPVSIAIGVEEARTYVIDIAGLEASRFIERMELANIAATGTFDGTIPIVFDAAGDGRLVGGRLVSREPGGNFAYVGELSYEDLGFFANYAFRTLRDLRYDRMDVALDGPLTGELVTQVRFTGIRQGELAERNLASRIIGELPIELRVNIRAPFYQLLTSLRALYDPSALRDPRSLGLLSEDGRRLREAVDQQAVDAMDEAAEQAERERIESLTGEATDIQDEESEPTP